MRADRLLKLAGFLENLKISQWDFGTAVCGTTTCALGWCPVVFKNTIKFDNVSECSLPTALGMENIYHMGAKIFNISIRESEYLFMPKESYSVAWLERMLIPDTCTATDVSRRIRKLVQYKLQKEHKFKQWEYRRFGVEVTDKRGVCV